MTDAQGPGPENRRGAPRLAMRCPVSILCQSTNGIWTGGETVDISWKGICITAPVACAVSETITISLPVFLDKDVHRQVSVRWRRLDPATKQYQIGGQFL